MKAIKHRHSLQRMVLLLFLICGLSVHGIAAANETPSLLPVPLDVQYRGETYTVPKAVLISIPEDARNAAGADWIADLISEHSGRDVQITTGTSDKAAIIVERVDQVVLLEKFNEAGKKPAAGLSEAYSLSIEPTGIRIQAAGSAGMFYGLTTLWQLLAHQPGTSGKLPTLDILDAPEFQWRGLMLDSARHMQSAEFIKRYIDWMSLHKLNVLHWHLTDDQAWRLEIKAYPKLTSVGGYRVPAGAAPAADIDPATGKPRLYGGFYSHDEIRDIVAHAAKRHITVVPEVDVPGHASAAIAAYPELGVDGFKAENVSADWGIFNNVFNLEESTFDFLEAVLAEVVMLFPSEFIHLGGDEVNLGQWKSSERITQRMQELGIKDFQSLQNFYVERLQDYLDQYDRRVIGWDEILESDLPPHAAVMSWRGVKGAIEAAEKGHQTVLSPSPVFYLDHIQTTAADAPPGRGGIVTVRDIYEFDPLPDTLKENRQLLLGLQANLWTEHIRTEKRAAYMTFPRAAAIAELGWAPASNRNWDSFAPRLGVHMGRLQALGIPAATDAYSLYREELPASSNADLREDRELELCQESVVLALEDDAPINGERESFLLDIMNPCWIWRDASLDSTSSVTASVGQLPFNFQIGDEINQVVVNEPETRDGELLVRLGNCEGPVIATLPLAPATSNQGVTELTAPLVPTDDMPKESDLCMSFTRPGIEPMWALDWIRLDRKPQ
jgi:hexosaminidase